MIQRGNNCGTAEKMQPFEYCWHGGFYR